MESSYCIIPTIVSGDINGRVFADVDNDDAFDVDG